MFLCIINVSSISFSLVARLQNIRLTNMHLHLRVAARLPVGVNLYIFQENYWRILSTSLCKLHILSHLFGVFHFLQTSHFCMLKPQFHFCKCILLILYSDHMEDVKFDN